MKAKRIDHAAKAAELRRDAKHLRGRLRKIALGMAELHEQLAARQQNQTTASTSPAKPLQEISQMPDMEKVCRVLREKMNPPAVEASAVPEPRRDPLALTESEQIAADKRVALQEFKEAINRGFNETALARKVRVFFEAQAAVRKPAARRGSAVSLRESKATFDLAGECARQVEALRRGCLAQYLSDRRRTYGF